MSPFRDSDLVILNYSVTCWDAAQAEIEITQ